MSNNNICSTCLSTGRTLTPLKLLGNNIMPFPIINKEQCCVCWECKAFILKFVKFKRQVAKAQIIIFNKNTKKKPNKVTSLSNLTVSHKDFYNEIIVWDENNKNDENDNMKDENDIFDSNSNEDFKNVTKCEKFEENDVFINEIDMIDENFEVDFETVRNNDENAGEKRDHVDVSIMKVKGDDLDIDVEPVTDKEQSLDDKYEFIEEVTLTKDELYKIMEEERNTERFRNASFKCLTCVCLFSSDRAFDKHKRKHVKGPYDRCSVCKQTFKKKGHVKFHHELHFRRYKCKPCGYMNTNFKVVLRHYNEKHAPVKEYPCLVCKEVFIKKIDLRRHRNQLHAKKKVIYECDLCGQRRLDKGNLIDHIRKHYGAVEKVPCPKCQKLYQRKYLGAHLKTHKERSETNYCVECDMTYKSGASFRRHLLTNRKHIQPEAFRFPCTYCEAKFTHRTALQCHVLSLHLKGFRYKCHVCDKGFVRKLPLQEHIMEKHEGKPLPKDKLCNICGKGFKRHRTLVHHIRTHTGEKPFECDQCDARFAQKTALTLHMKRHAKNSQLDKKIIEPVRNDTDY